MTCVDAAIIRALVEHIGMDPDSVGSGGSGSSFIQAEWSGEGSEYLSVKLADGEKIEIGTAIILPLPAEDVAGITYYCCDIGKDTSGQKTMYVFRSHQDSMTLKIVDETTHFSTNVPVNRLENMPDNTTTGIFKVSTISELVSLVMWLLRKAREEA